MIHAHEHAFLGDEKRRGEYLSVKPIQHGGHKTTDDCYSDSRIE